jgi:Tol biopolymer transport system component
MQFKQRLLYIVLSCLLILSGVVLLINVPAQAPEQAQITFQSDRDGNWEIYAIDTDGRNPLRLTNNPADDLSPAWSPDGQRIAFASSRDGNYEIYVMDADGKNQRNLANNPADDVFPDWFDPAFALVTPVSPAGNLRGTWGRLKQTSNCDFLYRY